jgi:hypothetical protein
MVEASAIPAQKRFRNWFSGVQLIQQGIDLFQIERGSLEILNWLQLGRESTPQNAKA